MTLNCHLWCWDYRYMPMAHLLDAGNQCVGQTRQAIYQLNYILSLPYWMEYRRVTWTIMNWCLSSLKLGIVIFWGKMQSLGQKKPCLHWGSGLPLSVSLEHVAHQEESLGKSHPSAANHCYHGRMLFCSQWVGRKTWTVCLIQVWTPWVWCGDFRTVVLNLWAVTLLRTEQPFHRGRPRQS